MSYFYDADICFTRLTFRTCCRRTTGSIQAEANSSRKYRPLTAGGTAIWAYLCTDESFLSGERAAEKALAGLARRVPAAAKRMLRRAAASHIRIEHFRDGFLPYMGSDVKKIFEQLKSVAPDPILTHRRLDAHQDHRLVSELTWKFRGHCLLEYEIPKYDGAWGTRMFSFRCRGRSAARRSV
jgi:hypothetical protein